MYVKSVIIQLYKYVTDLRKNCSWVMIMKKRNIIVLSSPLKLGVTGNFFKNRTSYNKHDSSSYFMIALIRWSFATSVSKFARWQNIPFGCTVCPALHTTSPNLSSNQAINTVRSHHMLVNYVMSRKQRCCSCETFNGSLSWKNFCNYHHCPSLSGKTLPRRVS